MNSKRGKVCLQVIDFVSPIGFFRHTGVTIAQVESVNN